MNDETEIEPGEPIERELHGGGTHTYRIAAETDQYLRVEAEQLGVDVEIELFGPGSSSPASADSPSGSEGTERLAEIVEAGGGCRIVVRSYDSEAPAGRYRLTVYTSHPASENERQDVAADRLFRQGEARRREGNNEARQAAIGKYREALTIWRSLEDARRQADALHRLGWMHHLLGSYPEAAAALHEALDLFRATEDRVWQAITLLQLSSTAYRQQDMARTLEAAEEALGLSRESGDELATASALLNITKARSAMGSVQLALEASEIALTTARAAGGLEEEILALYEQGNIFTLQGQLPRAIDRLEEALQLMRDSGVRVEAAAILDRLGTVYQRQGDVEKARDYLKRALKQWRREGDRRGEMVTLGNLGKVELLSGHPREALGHFRAGLGSEGSYPLEQAIALMSLGRYHYEVGELTAALEHHERAERIFERIDRPREAASNLYGSARALFKLGRAREARERLEPVLDSVESLRFEAAGHDLRTAFFTSKQHYYRLYIDILMHLHRQDPAAGHDLAALQAHQRRRARGLLDLLTEAKAEIRRGADPELLELELEVRARLEQVERAILDPRVEAEASFESLGKQRRRLRDELDDLQARIVTTNPQYEDLTRSEPLSVAEIQQQVLDSKTRLLMYSLGEEQSYLWMVPSEGPVESHVLPARREIETCARETRDAWSQLSEKAQQRGRRWSAELSRMILEPVAAHLGSRSEPRRILVVADGLLQHVPFAALPLPESDAKPDPPTSAHPEDGDRWAPLDPNLPVPLVETNQVVHLPSASVLASLRQELQDRQAAPSFLGVVADPVFSLDDARFEGASVQRGDPPGDSAPSQGSQSDLERAARQVGLTELKRLPYTEREAEYLRGLVGEGYRFEALGFEANRRRILRGDLKRFTLLHLATHGFVNETHPELSGLVLSLFDREGRPVDGFLRAHEIYNLDLLAELVVLSACKTGLGEEVEGEGILGLSRGFLYAGAPRLVVSLWNVSDQGTSELMQRFYRHLLVGEEGLSRKRFPAASLRVAQREMLRDERWQAPYYWAGFVFQGEWKGPKGSDDDSIEPKPKAEPSADPDADLPLKGKGGGDNDPR